MVPKQPTNQPTDRQTGGTQPTDEQTSAGFGKQQKTQEKVSFQAFTMRKQSCSLPCHCKAVRNTLANTQVSQTSKTRPHARNNWGTWRGHNNHLEAAYGDPWIRMQKKGWYSAKSGLGLLLPRSGTPTSLGNPMVALSWVFQHY